MIAVAESAKAGYTGAVSDPLRRYRAGLAVFVAGLALSGVTAFPLLAEVSLLARWLGIAPSADPAAYEGLRHWIALVRLGLDRSYAAYPWLAYGTDWLAFGHLAIAVFFIGPWRDPLGNRWALRAGLLCCAAVVPTALIAGAVRGVPLGWRLVDCSFGVLGALPLLYCLSLESALERERAALAASRGTVVSA